MAGTVRCRRCITTSHLQQCTRLVRRCTPRRHHSVPCREVTLTSFPCANLELVTERALLRECPGACRWSPTSFLVTRLGFLRVLKEILRARPCTCCLASPILSFFQFASICFVGRLLYCPTHDYLSLQQFSYTLTRDKTTDRTDFLCCITSVSTIVARTASLQMMELFGAIIVSSSGPIKVRLPSPMWQPPLRNKPKEFSSGKSVVPYKGHTSLTQTNVRQHGTSPVCSHGNCRFLLSWEMLLT